MSIVINLDVMMARRKMKSQDLAKIIDITNANLSILKTNKAKAIRLSTLNAICKALECTPGDILEFVDDDEPEETVEPINNIQNTNKEGESYE